jgi:S1-C subfamily serine protease
MKYRFIRYVSFVVLVSALSSLLIIGIVTGIAWHYRAGIARSLLATVPSLPAISVSKEAVPLTPALPVIVSMKQDVPVAKPLTVTAPATIASAVAKVNQSVVSIEVIQTQNNASQAVGGGSGFFISRGGLLLTNNHVIDFPGTTFTVVTTNGNQYPAVVVAKDPKLDIALLQVQVPASTVFPPVAFGDSDTVQLGQNVVAIGYALGELTNSISAGIISGLSRDITAGNAANGKTEDLSGLIQTDAAINPGNSGGPLLTLDGIVIGVNIATATGSQSIGFALPINEVKAFVNAHK